MLTVVPIDKKNDDKYVISNFKSVSILNCFPNVYENVIKNESSSISSYNSLSKELHYATCLVKTTGRTERTFSQQQNSGKNINGSFKGF